MNVEDLPSWIAMYGTLTSDLFKSNVALTYDNVGNRNYQVHRPVLLVHAQGSFFCLRFRVRDRGVGWCEH